ncbi:hypothetical protein OHA21_15665 [Actinoplanes sp. NBC_00393]
MAQALVIAQARLAQIEAVLAASETDCHACERIAEILNTPVERRRS